MVVRIIQALIMLLGLGMTSSWAMADTATASLDRSVTAVGESVLLQIHVNGSADKDPDLSVLNKDFELLNQSQSSNYSLVNGSLKRSKSWSITLMPKHEGNISIPPLSLGNIHTQALLLQVRDTPVAPGLGSVKDVFLEVSLSSEKVYVQAQVILDIKLFRAVNLAQAQLTEPVMDHAIVKRLGEDKNYETIRDQRRFVVTERRYALFPKQSGTLAIPALKFTGQVVPPVGMYSQGGRILRVKSKALDIQVLPMPNTWPQAHTWLPAEDVTIQEISSDDQAANLKVGEAFTRIIEIRAKGLTAEQLPKLLSQSANSVFKQYPDKAELHTEMHEHGVVGIRREKVAMIPTQAGDLALPAISVTWWNTATQSMEKAVVLQRTLTVQQGDATVLNKPVISKAIVKEKTVTTHVDAVVNDKESSAVNVWQVLTILFGSAWLLTMLFWWYQKRHSHPQKPRKEAISDVKLLRKELEQACKAAEAKQVERLLPKWAAAFLQDDQLGCISQLKGKSAALDQALSDLQTFLYGSQHQPAWHGDEMLEAISKLHQSTPIIEASDGGVRSFIVAS